MKTKKFDNILKKVLSSTNFAWVALIVIPILIASPYIIHSDQIPGKADGLAAKVLYPFQFFSASEIQSGRVPFWNPYIFLGTPHLAHPQSAVFYPVHLLGSILGVATAMSLSIWIHALLMMTGGYCWARALGVSKTGAAVASMVLVLSPQAAFQLSQGRLLVYWTMAYIPWICLSLYKYMKTGKALYGCWAILLFSLAFLAGDSPFFFLALAFFIAVILACRDGMDEQFISVERGIWMLIAAVGGATACVLFQLGPTLDYVANSVQIDIQPASQPIFFFPIENFLTVIIPDIFGSGMAGYPYYGRFHFEETSAYFGVSALILICGGWKGASQEVRRLGIVGVLIAIAATIPPFGRVLATLGWTRYSGGAGELLYFSAALLIPLIGRGFDRWTDKNSDDPSPFGIQIVKTAIVAMIFTIIVLGVTVWISDGVLWAIILDRLPTTGFESHPLLDLTEASNASAAFWDAVGSLMRSLGYAGIAVALIWARRRTSKRGMLEILWFLLIAFDLMTFIRPYMHRTDPATLRLPADLVDIVRKDPKRGRVVLEPGNANVAMIEQIETPFGEGPRRLKSYEKILMASEGRRNTQPAPFTAKIGFLRSTSAGWALGRSPYWRGDTTAVRSGDWGLFETLDVLPRFFVASKPNINRLVHEYDTSAERLSADRGKERVRVQASGPSHVIWTAVNDGNWEVTTGRTPTLLTGDILAVPVEAGTHEVEIKYSPHTFWFLAPISLLAMTAELGALLYFLWKERRAS